MQNTEITNMTTAEFDLVFYSKVSEATREPLPVGVAIQKILDEKKYTYKENSTELKRVRYIGFKVWEVGGKDWKKQVFEGVRDRLALDGIRAIHRAMHDTPNKPNPSAMDAETNRRLNAYLRKQDAYFFNNGYID